MERGSPPWMYLDELRKARKAAEGIKRYKRGKARSFKSGSIFGTTRQNGPLVRSASVYPVE